LGSPVRWVVVVNPYRDRRAFFRTANFIREPRTTQVFSESAVLVNLHAENTDMLALHRDHRLEGFERLDRSLEPDRSRLDAMFCCSLSYNRADEVVGQDMRPQFLPDEFRGFAS